MSAPLTANLTFVRGDTWQFQVVITSDADGTIPVNITGYTFAAQCRSNPDISAISGTATCTVVDGAQGTLTVSWSSTVTDAIDPGLYYWDLQQTAGSAVTTIMAGQITVLADVTR
jgi:hypothetical protein